MTTKTIIDELNTVIGEYRSPIKEPKGVQNKRIKHDKTYYNKSKEQKAEHRRIHNKEIREKQQELKRELEKFLETQKESLLINQKHKLNLKSGKFILEITMKVLYAKKN